MFNHVKELRWCYFHYYTYFLDCLLKSVSSRWRHVIRFSVKSFCRGYQQSKQWAVYPALHVVVCSWMGEREEVQGLNLHRVPQNSCITNNKQKQRTDFIRPVPCLYLALSPHFLVPGSSPSWTKGLWLWSFSPLPLLTTFKYIMDGCMDVKLDFLIIFLHRIHS